MFCSIAVSYLDDKLYLGEKKVLPAPLDSILDAVLTVSPNRQYLGMVSPTTPATTEPVCKP